MNLANDLQVIGTLHTQNSFALPLMVVHSIVLINIERQACRRIMKISYSIWIRILNPWDLRRKKSYLCRNVSNVLWVSSIMPLIAKYISLNPIFLFKQPSKPRNSFTSMKLRRVRPLPRLCWIESVHQSITWASWITLEPCNHQRFSKGKVTSAFVDVSFSLFLSFFTLKMV